MKAIPLVALLALLTVGIPAAATAAPGTEPAKIETAAARDARMQWFRDGHFGMFIHFGLYSDYAGVWKGKVTKVNNCAEWMMCAAKADRNEYAQAAKTFNPKDFNADEWMRNVRDAGMKYIIITTKHHDGFAMFDTKASDYNVMNTPFGRDVIGEVVRACRKYGIKVGFYYSQNYDWTHPGGGGNWWQPLENTPEGHDKYYRTIVKPQMREILSNYGKVDILWFDIPENNVLTPAHAADLNRMIRELQPGIVVNNRLGHGMPFDVQTPENYIPPTGIPGADWESCITMNHSWGYAADDHDYKTVSDMVRKLVDITSKGGAMLLNVGPDGRGRMPDEAVTRLRGIGDWLKVNGEALYGCRASVFPQLPAWGRYTVKDDPYGKNAMLYAIVFDPPKDGRLVFPGLTTKIRHAYKLGDTKTSLEISYDNPLTPVVHLTPAMMEKDFAVALVLDGGVKISDAVTPDADSAVTLGPRSAKCRGQMRVEMREINGLQADAYDEEHLGYWLGKSDGASWKFQTFAPGTYRVELRWGAAHTAKGSVISLNFDGKKLPFTIDKTTGSAWNKHTYRTDAVGELTLPAGEHLLTLELEKLVGVCPANLVHVRLVPVTK